ncbi:MAG: hypothetical protein R6U58_07410 [Bacteroidales bacterium]
MKRKILLITIHLLLISGYIHAQCACGGMSGGIGAAGTRFGLSAVGAGSLQLQLAYDFNYMDNLYSGKTRLENENLVRLIHTGIFGANYGITRNLSITGIFLYLGQEMASTRADGFRYVDYLYGFGDVILMANYRLTNPLAYNGWEISAGAGPKLPTGRFTYTGTDDALIPMEAQLGTGSLDVITWASFAKSHLFITNLNFGSGMMFRLSGRNSNYLEGQVYDFGNELQSNAGLIYNVHAGYIFDIFNFVRYRYQAKDFIDGESVGNTGGHWLFTSPGVRAGINEKFSAFISADIPLYHNLNGPQLTTTIRFSIGVSYTIERRQTIELMPHP